MVDDIVLIIAGLLAFGGIIGALVEIYGDDDD